MASRAVIINDTLESIKSSVIPGRIVENRFEFPEIQYTVASGAMNSWAITVAFYRNGEPELIEEKYLSKPCFKFDENFEARISVKSGKIGNKPREVADTIVKVGKNLGKVNETNCLTQAIRDALGKHNSQQKSKTTQTNGDSVTDLDKISVISETVNELTPPPMLVSKDGSSKAATLNDDEYGEGLILQRKLNGVRCIITMINNAVYAYSRTCKEYKGICKIKEDVKKIFDKYPNIRLDGELYKHGKPITWISGQARREKDDDLLEYHVYDVFYIDNITLVTQERQSILDNIFSQFKFTQLKRVENFIVRNRAEVDSLVAKFIDEQYEGGIIRRNGAPYQYSYNKHRSTNVIKIKFTYDEEYPIVGYSKGVGADEGAVIWRCAVTPEHSEYYKADDCEFNVVPIEISKSDRRKIYDHITKITDKGTTIFEEKIKGLLLTVKYSELSTKTGIPQQAKGVTIRSYENGPDNDYLAAILRA